ncbi:MAG: hypothetical protein AAFV49_22915 [Pseudomonadota bacterium]
MLVRSFAILAAALALSACAIGHEYDYSAVQPKVAAGGEAPLAIAVADMRGYVLDGEKAPDFVGLQRSGVAIPYPVSTASGAPLAEDFAGIVARAYGEAGRETEILPLTPGGGAGAARAAFAGSGAEKLLVIDMVEWKTDVYSQVTVHWDLVARVYDRTGALLAEAESRGVEGTGSSELFEAGNSEIAAQEAARRLGELLAAPEIEAALI